MDTVEKLLKEGKRENYGTNYANHYKEDFIKNTNKKLGKFLKTQGFV
jgi:hypothetical protein